jgi:hypothetical protein
MGRDCTKDFVFFAGNNLELQSGSRDFFQERFALRHSFFLFGFSNFL